VAEGGQGGQGGLCGVFLLHIDEGTLHSSSGLGHFDEGGVLFSPSAIILIGAPTLPFSEGRKGLLKGHVGDSQCAASMGHDDGHASTLARRPDKDASPIGV